MRLDELSFGQVYVDTNILYMYLRADLEYLPIIKTFLGRVVSGEIAVFVSVPVLDELFYRLLLARIKGSTSLNPFMAV
jgi:predicted nucleic acid-binding protein